VSPTVGGLAEAGRAIGSAATAGELLIGETDSDETTWWLLKVTDAQQQVPADYKFPNLHCDVVFEYGRAMQQKVAVLVQRFRSSATGRGEDSYFFLRPRHDRRTIFLSVAHAARQSPNGCGQCQGASPRPGACGCTACEDGSGHEERC
jgi:hypothetical protein